MKTRMALMAAALSVFGFAACSKHQQLGEVDWAKAALARNPALEIVATDEKARVFTVRETATGTLLTLHVDDLIAAPPPPKVAAQPASPPAPAAVETPPNPAAPAVAGEAAQSQTTDALARNEAAAGKELAAGPGYSIHRGDAQAAAPPPEMEGPGYSITREAPTTRPSTPSAESVVADAEKRSDPIVCQGDRLMHIDGETIDSTGDAVIAENGCDLYISNARIRAGGVGIIARQARVHIVNSTIGGSRGSYEASEGAEIYVARSTFAGVGRRFDTARMNDLGGNEYTLAH